MSRSVHKGPYVDPGLLNKVLKLKSSNSRSSIKTWSRRSTIVPDFIGFVFLVHNGRKFYPVSVNERMVGHKLGEFVSTRLFKGHQKSS